MMNMNIDLDMKKDNLLKELNIITIIFRFSGVDAPPIIQKCFLDDEFEFVKKKSKKIKV